MERDYELETVKDNGNGNYFIWCAGCDQAHIMDSMALEFRAGCSFDGNFIRPTILPKSYTQHWKTFFETIGKYGFCAFTVIDGCINYQPHCKHHLAGLSVELRPRKEWGGIKFSRDDDGEFYAEKLI